VAIGVADEPSRCASERLIDPPFDLSITISAEVITCAVYR
jgi:hypothetical protein